MIKCSVATIPAGLGGSVDVAVTHSPAAEQIVIAVVVTPASVVRRVVVDAGGGWFRVDRVVESGVPVLAVTGPEVDGEGVEGFMSRHGYTLPLNATWADHYADAS